MKKILALLLVALMALSLVACGGGSGKTDLNDLINSLETQAENNDNDTDSDTDSDNNNFNNDTEDDGPINLSSIEEQVIYDAHNIKVTATELTNKDFYGPTLTFLVENGTDKDITVSTDVVTVNGMVMTYASMYAQASGGKKVYDDMSFDEDELRKNDIKELGVVEFTLKIYDSDYNDIDETGRLKVVINENVKSTLDTSGEVIYDDNNVKVYAYDPEVASDDYNTYIADLLVVNNSKYDISLSADDVSVNGFMIDPYFYCRVPAGCASYAEFEFSNDDLEENKITKIEEVEFILEAYDYNTYDDIFESSVIKYLAD